MFFDTHTHYDDKRFHKILPDLMEELKEKNIVYMINAARNVQSNERMKELGKKYPQMRRAVGRHPKDVDANPENDEQVIAALKAMLKDPDVCAVGETGFDFHHNADWARQEFWFREQISWAKEYNLPLILHLRGGMEEALAILDEQFEKESDAESLQGTEHSRTMSRPYRGVFHCFTGDFAIASEYIRRGFLIGIGGKVTNPDNTELREAVKQMPLDVIVLETDCPYLIPYGYKGTNHSLFLPMICDAVAEIKGISAKEVEESTYQNAMRLFSLE